MELNVFFFLLKDETGFKSTYTNTQVEDKNVLVTRGSIILSLSFGKRHSLTISLSLTPFHH